MAGAVALVVVAQAMPASGAELATQLRRPVALQLSADQSRLYVANRDSGTITVVDTASHEVAGEYPLGRLLSDLTATGDSTRLLATDEQTHELLLVDVAGEAPEVVARAKVAPYPVGVVADPESRRAYVSSLWSRQLTVVDWSKDDTVLRVVEKLDLPLAPRKQLLLPERGKLLVADSFAARLAVVDLASLRVEGERTFPGHNIRGLGTTPDGRMLLVSHQMLNELAHTIRNDVHWGLLMSNDLRWFKLDAMLNLDGNLFDGAHMHPLGEANSATADPQDLFVAADGTVVIALGGVGEIALGRERDFSLHRVKVGKRPVDVVIADDSRTAYVANMFGDSVSVVDLAKRQTVAEISLGPKPKLTLEQRGELLFYDGNLSHDGWMTCNSCHTDGHTNGLQNDNLSDDSFGAPKRVLTLLGVKDTAPYAWNGKVERVEDQIRNSIEKTMQSGHDAKDEHVSALAAYLRTFEPPPSVDALRGRQDDEAIVRGSELFADLQCIQCHAPPFYTTPQTYDVGLHDSEGNREFNPPSLRGLAQRGPYLHDNQTKRHEEPPLAQTIEDVLLKVGHQLDRDLTERELGDLLAFLRSL